VDLRQNIFDIESEIALQDALMKRKGEVRILWKNPPGQNDLPLGHGDLKAIIEYFGAGMIVDVYKNKQGFEPLVDLEQLLPHIQYSQSEAQIMWDIVFSDQSTGFRYPLDLLIKIVRNQVAEASTNREYCNLFITNIEYISATLKSNPTDKYLLFSKLQTFQLLKYIIKLDEPQVSSCIIKLNLLSSITELFFKFANSSIFLSEFVEYMDHILTSNSLSTFTLLSHMLVQCGFFKRLLTLFINESTRPISKRSGNFGHMTKIANKIHESFGRNKKLEKLLEGFSEWTPFISALELVNTVMKTPQDLKPAENINKDKKPPVEFDDSLM